MDADGPQDPARRSMRRPRSTRHELLGRESRRHRQALVRLAGEVTTPPTGRAKSRRVKAGSDAQQFRWLAEVCAGVTCRGACSDLAQRQNLGPASAGLSSPLLRERCAPCPSLLRSSPRRPPPRSARPGRAALPMPSRRSCSSSPSSSFRLLALLLRSVTEPELGLQNYVQLLRLHDLLADLPQHLPRLRPRHADRGPRRLPGRLDAGDHAAPLGQVVFAIIILSMWTNLLARTYAWMVLLQRTGVINKTLMALGLIDEPLALVNNLVGVTIGMTYIMLPFMILPLTGIIRAIDPAIAPGRVALRRQPRPGASAASCCRWPCPASLAGAPDGLRHVARLLRHPGTARRHREHDAGRADRAVRPVAGQLGHGRCRGLRPARHHAWRSTRCSSGFSAPAAWEVREMLLDLQPSRLAGSGRSFGFTVLVAALPAPADPVHRRARFGSSQWLVFPPPSWTLKWYQDLFADPRWIEAALTSLKIALVVTVLSVLLGLLASLRPRPRPLPRRRDPARPVPDADDPAGVVFAVALYAFFLRLGLNGTLTGFVIAHTILALPFAIIVHHQRAGGLRQVDRGRRDPLRRLTARGQAPRDPAGDQPSASSPARSSRSSCPGTRWCWRSSWPARRLQTLPVKIWATLRQDLTPGDRRRLDAARGPHPCPDGRWPPSSAKETPNDRALPADPGPPHGVRRGRGRPRCHPRHPRRASS